MYKREFVSFLKSSIPMREMERMASESTMPRGFTAALKRNRVKKCSLIAEVKTASPSKGIIRDDVDAVEIARIYEENGATCISVLTDEKYFMGNLDRLKKIRENVRIPLLRKDFIVDPYQIYEARHAGADAVLLIAACLKDDELADFIELASLLELDCMVEVHNEAEMIRIGRLNTQLVGINNRDLRTFQTDIAVTGRLAGKAPDGVVLVSESGIDLPSDVVSVRDMGAHAILVGESLMREKDIGKKVREIVNIL